MPTEFKNEESFQNESGNLKQTEKDNAERDDYLKDQEQIRKSKDTAHRFFYLLALDTFWGISYSLLYLVLAFGRFPMLVWVLVERVTNR